MTSNSKSLWKSKIRSVRKRKYLSTWISFLRVISFRSHHNSKKVGGKLREKEQLISACEESWARIQEITGTSDLDKMIDDFITVEQKSFALFNFINEQNNNIEQKMEDIDNINAQYK